jgi:hypothetical protein
VETQAGLDRLRARASEIAAAEGQWMLSVQHIAEDIAAYIQAFGDYCAMVAGGK